MLVLRDHTERPEGVDTGIAKLVGASEHGLFREAGALIADAAHYERMARSHCPYGDGNAGRQIVAALAGRHLEEDSGVYETPVPEHPLDALLHDATEEVPKWFAQRVIARARRRREALDERRATV